MKKASPIRTTKQKRLTRLQVMLSADELTALDNFRFEKRMPSLAAAIRETSSPKPDPAPVMTAVRPLKLFIPASPYFAFFS